MSIVGALGATGYYASPMLSMLFYSLFNAINNRARHYEMEHRPGLPSSARQVHFEDVPYPQPQFAHPSAPRQRGVWIEEGV
jgi:hypothetical protein